MGKYLLCFLLATFSCEMTIAQGSADSRVCNCFSTTIATDFLKSTKAIYGSIGLFISNGLEIKPAHSQSVRFILPAIAAAKGCTASYTIYVSDAAGNKVYELTGANKEISYSFPACAQTYNVLLMASAKASSGSSGNCTRRLNFKVTPQCNTAVCHCATGKGSKSGSISADMGLGGNVTCKPSTSTLRNYALRAEITNKTTCVLKVQSITVHGQTVNFPAVNIAPRSVHPAVTLAFSTLFTQSAPADSKLTAVIRYSLNGVKCVFTQEIPYISCP